LGKSEKPVLGIKKYVPEMIRNRVRIITKDLAGNYENQYRKN